MPLPFPFDFKNPDYRMVVEWRLERLKKIRENPKSLSSLYHFYKNNPAQFIIDWGNTYDPRNIEKNLPATIPFLLFPKQEEWVHWFIERWKNQERGLTEKSRELGMSWLTMSIATTLCLFNEGVSVGVGSRKEVYVDQKSDPGCLLYKVRFFLSALPKEFRRDWNEKKHSPWMRVIFPNSGSIIIGEAGESLFRGARCSFIIVDESAFLSNAASNEASISQATNCRQDISTPNGTGNPFYQRRISGNTPVFTFHWKDDPRKNEEWYQKQIKKIDDPIIIAQELDLDYAASIENVLIPSIWVTASIDAHIKLNIKAEGEKRIGFDVADKGRDKNAAAGRKGPVLEILQEWSGADSDIFKTVEKVFEICDMHDYPEVYYDADGLGAGVRGDARVINERRKKNIPFYPFVGSSNALYNPKGDMFLGTGELKDGLPARTNEDYLKNLKAQGWWALRRRFLITYRAITQNEPFNPADIISLPSNLNKLRELMQELSQPTYKKEEGSGKMLVDKMPDDVKSPNLADAVMICFAPVSKSWGFFSS